MFGSSSSVNPSISFQPGEIYILLSVKFQSKTDVLLPIRAISMRSLSCWFSLLLAASVLPCACTSSLVILIRCVNPLIDAELISVCISFFFSSLISIWVPSIRTALPLSSYCVFPLSRIQTQCPSLCFNRWIFS